jgi:hypothetical protein
MGLNINESSLFNSFLYILYFHIFKASFPIADESNCGRKTDLQGIEIFCRLKSVYTSSGGIIIQSQKAFCLL